MSPLLIKLNKFHANTIRVTFTFLSMMNFLLFLIGYPIWVFYTRHWIFMQVRGFMTNTIWCICFLIVVTNSPIAIPWKMCPSIRRGSSSFFPYLYCDGASCSCTCCDRASCPCCNGAFWPWGASWLGLGVGIIASAVAIEMRRLTLLVALSFSVC